MRSVEYRNHCRLVADLVYRRTHDLPPPDLPPLPPKKNVPKGWEAMETSLNGVRGLGIVRAEKKNTKALLHIHGGGLHFGSASDYDSFRVVAAARLGVDCWSCDYTLATEKPYPAALEDCFWFYKGMLEAGYRDIALYSDSSGGCLAMSLMYYIRSKGEKMPAGFANASSYYDAAAVIDGDPADPMYEWHQRGIRLYAGGLDLKDPLISAYHGDPAGFPPCMIVCGGDEPLAEEMYKMAHKLQRAGVKVCFLVWEDMDHNFAMDLDFYPEASAATEEMLSFCERVFCQ